MLAVWLFLAHSSLFHRPLLLSMTRAHASFFNLSLLVAHRNRAVKKVRKVNRADCLCVFVFATSTEALRMRDCEAPEASCCESARERERGGRFLRLGSSLFRRDFIPQRERNSLRLAPDTNISSYFSIFLFLHG